MDPEELKLLLHIRMYTHICIFPHSVYDNLTLTTRSNPSAFPSALRLKRQLVTTVSTSGDGQDGARADEATIKEKCPKCGNEEMRFSTLQMRSADEGTTVFYTCPQCGYKFSQ